ncbi:hypothetical protein CK934_00415 [Chitinophaga sp. MD30]|nr:hypothetical protein CK934_00415 [Chitinophaga sp. MD30]
MRKVDRRYRNDTGGLWERWTGDIGMIQEDYGKGGGYYRKAMFQYILKVRKLGISLYPLNDLI